MPASGWGVSLSPIQPRDFPYPVFLLPAFPETGSGQALKEKQEKGIGHRERDNNACLHGMQAQELFHYKE
jgi:hypothetical protein